MGYHSQQRGTTYVHPPLGFGAADTLGTDTSYPYSVPGNLVGAVLIRDDNNQALWRVDTTTGSESIERGEAGSTRSYTFREFVDPASTDAYVIEAGGRERVALDTVTDSLTIGNATDLTKFDLFGHLQLNELLADPAAVANTGLVYTKDVGAISELFFRDSSGNVVQITSGGSVSGGGSGTSNLTWTVNEDGTSATNENPALVLRGGDGVISPNDDLVTTTLVQNSNVEDCYFYMQRNRASGGDVFIDVALWIGAPGVTTSVTSTLGFSSGTGAANRLASISYDGATNLLLLQTSSAVAAGTIYLAVRPSSVAALLVSDGSANYFAIHTDTNEVQLGNATSIVESLGSAFTSAGTIAAVGTISTDALFATINANASAAANEDPYFVLLGGDGGTETIRTILYQDSSADAAYLVTGLAGDTLGQSTKSTTLWIGPNAGSTTDTDTAFGIRGYNVTNTLLTVLGTFDVSLNRLTYTTAHAGTGIQFSPGNLFYVTAGGDVQINTTLSTGLFYLRIPSNSVNGLRVYDGTLNYLAIDTTAAPKMTFGNESESIDYFFRWSPTAPGTMSWGSATGNKLRRRLLTENHTLALATTSDSTIVIPTNCIILAIAIKILTSVTGPATLDVGETTDRNTIFTGLTPITAGLDYVAETIGAQRLPITNATDNAGVGPTTITIGFEAGDGVTAFTGGSIEINVWIEDVQPD